GKQPSQRGNQSRFALPTNGLGSSRRPAPAAGAACRPQPASALCNGSGSRAGGNLVDALTQSKVYREYEQAFTEATGMPVALRPAESWQLPLHGKRHEAPYCAFMSEKSRACASCLQVQEKLAQAASREAHTMVCPAGLCET